MAAIKSKNTHFEFFFASYYLPAACDTVQVHLRWKVFWIFGSLDIIQQFLVGYLLMEWLHGLMVNWILLRNLCMRTVTHMWLERKMEKLVKFDVAEYLDTDELQTFYLDEVEKENNPATLIKVINTVARAKGMTKTVKEAEIPRK